MSDKHNEEIEVPGIRETDHDDLVNGARAASAGDNLDKFVEGVFEAAEFFSRQGVGKPVDNNS